MNYYGFSVGTDHTKGFHLDLEDFLHGLLQLSSELVNIKTIE